LLLPQPPLRRSRARLWKYGYGYGYGPYGYYVGAAPVVYGAPYAGYGYRF
jgi:hypothetical protein